MTMLDFKPGPSIRIGFWTGGSDNPLVGVVERWLGKHDPLTQVDRNWSDFERDAVASYLRRFAKVHCRWMGYSWCRFKCGISDEKMGSADMTDGVFIWPEGYIHYVEKHLVKPPTMFIRHAVYRLATHG